MRQFVRLQLPYNLLMVRNCPDRRIGLADPYAHCTGRSLPGSAWLLRHGPPVSSKTAHLGDSCETEIAEDVLESMTASDAADPEAAPPPATALQFVAIMGAASDNDTVSGHSNAEAALHEAVTTRIFNRRAYSERYGTLPCSQTDSLLLPMQLQLEEWRRVSAHLQT